MHEDPRVPEDKPSSPETPNSLGLWLTIAVVVAVVMVVSDQAGPISSLLYLFGPIVLVMIVAAKVADSASLQRAFGKPKDDSSPVPDDQVKADSTVPKTPDRERESPD
jgi:hypothetical protein